MPVPTNYKWLFHDPVAVTSYRLPINPNKMTSPFPQKQLETLTNVFGAKRTRRLGTVAAYEWTFSGVIRTTAHHDAMITWVNKNNAFEITDHLDRTWTVLPVRFNVTEKKPSRNNPDRFDYEFTVLVLGGPA